MSDTKRNQAVIGLFVVGAVVLLVIGLIVFGSGRLFEKTDKFVLYFDGSVKGLNVGAPVTFRGVKIGSVTDISVHANPKNMEVRIPVTIETPRDRVESTMEMAGSDSQAITRLIENGLRAKLDLQSMVTGQLQINLEFLPDEPVRLSGIKNKYPEIPTVPTVLHRLAKKMEGLPLEEMVLNASSALESLKTLLTNPALPEMINRLGQATTNIKDFTAKVDQRTIPLMESLQRIADHADQLVLDVNARIKPLAGDAEQVLGSGKTAADRVGAAADALAQLTQGAQPAIDNAGQMFANVAEMTDTNAKERYELRNTLKELSEAARSLRVLTQYLERHPEALITGKSGSKRR